MRALGVALAAFVAAAAQAQQPDIHIRTDVRLTYAAVHRQDTGLRWYDRLGRVSTVGLSMRLEPGLTAVVTQRLQRIPGDGDDDPLELYYVENPGSWRIGKQSLPFGTEALYWETAIAARVETVLALGGFPVAVAICDSGKGRPRGAAGRVQAGPVGLSAANGDHFGVGAGAFATVRNPEDAAGEGRGYRTMFGIDGAKGLGAYGWLEAEYVILRDGHTALDPNRAILDVRWRYELDPDVTVSLAFARDSVAGNFFRAQGSWPLGRSVRVEPFVRFREGTLFDLAVTLRLTL